MYEVIHPNGKVCWPEIEDKAYADGIAVGLTSTSSVGSYSVREVEPDTWEELRAALASSRNMAAMPGSILAIARRLLAEHDASAAVEHDGPPKRYVLEFCDADRWIRSSNLPTSYADRDEAQRAADQLGRAGYYEYRVTEVDA